MPNCRDVFRKKKSKKAPFGESASYVVTIPVLALMFQRAAHAMSFAPAKQKRARERERGKSQAPGAEARQGRKRAWHPWGLCLACATSECTWDKRYLDTKPGRQRKGSRRAGQKAGTIQYAPYFFFQLKLGCKGESSPSHHHPHSQRI